MLLLLLIYVVLRALWKIDVHLISTLVNISLYYYYYYYLLVLSVQFTPYCIFVYLVCVHCAYVAYELIHSMWLLL